MADPSECACGWRADMSDAAFDIPSVQLASHVRLAHPDTPPSSNPGSKLEQVGAAGGGLTEEEREELRTAYPYIDVGDDRTGVEHVVERIVREREAAAWDAGYAAGKIADYEFARNPYWKADR